VERYESDLLTHFVGKRLRNDDERFALLVQILKEGQLRGSGRNVVSAGTISAREMFDPDIVCFCDIPLGGLAIHIEKYSAFGIAFEKKALARHGGASPVFYVALGSTVFDPGAGARVTRGQFFDKMAHLIFKQLDESASRDKEEAFPISASVNGRAVEPGDRILTARSDTPSVAIQHFMNSEILPFIVPFDETLPIDHINNYYMEREWRVRGALRFTLADISQILVPTRFVVELERSFPGSGLPVLASDELARSGS
jgi:Putative abortive phage resistance protein AbiGi, antitoxin